MWNGRTSGFFIAFWEKSFFSQEAIIAPQDAEYLLKRECSTGCTERNVYRDSGKYVILFKTYDHAKDVEKL